MNNTIFIKLFLFPLVLFSFSCSNGSSTKTDTSQIDSFTNSLTSQFSDSNLISSIEVVNNQVFVTFENQSTATISGDLVNYNSQNWETNFTFSDGSNVVIGSVGDQLNIDYLNGQNTNTPLSRKFFIDIPYDGYVSWRVEGRNGLTSDIFKSNVTALGGRRIIPVHGIYRDGTTKVIISYYNFDNVLRFEESFDIEAFPEIDNIDFIDFDVTVNEYPNEQRFFLLSHRSYEAPMVLDQWGDVRYFLNERVSFGLKQADDGNIYWAFGNSIKEANLAGDFLVNEQIPEKYGNIHHDILKINDDVFILTVNNLELTTLEDWIIAYDIQNDVVINEWDLNLSVPKTDYFIGSDGRADTFNDWFHVNAIDYVEDDNSLLISGQRSAVVKVSWENDLQWILTDPVRFQNQDKILLNQQNEIITWGQHNIRFDPSNNNYYLFDNGLGRNYSNDLKFSRDVKFNINEDDFTYDILDTYGQNYPEYHSPIISGIDFDEQNNVIVLFGSIGYELNYVNNKDWIGNIFKTPVPEYGAVIQEYNENGELKLEIKVSGITGDINNPSSLRDVGIYRVSRFNF